MEKKTINEININNKINKDESLTKNQKTYNFIPKIDFKLNNKYENALLEELYNSKDKSWRTEAANNIIPDKNNDKNKIRNSISTKDFFIDKEKILNPKEKNVGQSDIIKNANNKSDRDKNDRFKDFDDILFLEETKDKKRKFRSEQKLPTFDKYEIPKPPSEKQSSRLIGFMVFFKGDYTCLNYYII